uniref:Uncharacterized protein n=1 Tax=Glycine max TaxID=3847 RepID=K7MDP6_SOYBN
MHSNDELFRILQNFLHLIQHWCFGVYCFISFTKWQNHDFRKSIVRNAIKFSIFRDLRNLIISSNLLLSCFLVHGLGLCPRQYNQLHSQ